MWLAFLCVTLFAQCEERQHIVNIREVNRCYAVVHLADGYRTQIPVINGYLPEITEFRGCNEIELMLDYGPLVRRTYTGGEVWYGWKRVALPERVPEYSVPARPVPRLIPKRPTPQPDPPVSPKPEPMRPKPTPELRPTPEPKPPMEPKISKDTPIQPPIESVRDPLDQWLREPSEVK